GARDAGLCDADSWRGPSWAHTGSVITSVKSAASAASIVSHVGRVISIPPRAASPGGRVLLEAHVFHLVEQGPVADLEHLRRLHPVPAALLERAADHLALRLQHRTP